MKKVVIYRYLGTNGVIESPVHLEDVYYTRLYQLIADDGKILINGDKKVKIITVPEDEVDDWAEGQE